MKSIHETLHVAHITNVIDGRQNSGTARIAKELILQLSKNTSVIQTFIHFDNGFDEIYMLPNTSEVKIPLRNFPIAKQFLSFLLYWVKTRFNSNVSKFDVVHWHASRVFPFFFIIPSKKIIITLHDANNRIIRGSNTIWTHIFYWNLRLSKNKISYIIGDSLDACNKLVQIAKFPASKVKCIYLNSNFDNLKSNKPKGVVEGETYMTCVSRWQPFKNVTRLIEGYSLAQRLNPSIPKLILVGKPVAGFSEPIDKIKSLNLQSSITVLSDLLDEELAYLYDNSVLNITPSLHEGFGLSVLEGIKRGCPSLDHMHTSTSEISGDAGLHIDMNSASEISQSLIMLFSDGMLLKELRKNTVYRAKQFSWENTTIQLLRLYES